MQARKTRGANSGRRTNASLLVQRLNTTPVQLYPPALHDYLVESKRHQGASCALDFTDGGSPQRERVVLLPLPGHDAGLELPTRATKGGLGASDILIVGKNAECHEVATEWAYTCAAAHALREGRVVYVHAPGSGALQLRRFAACMERLVLAGYADDDTHLHVDGVSHDDETDSGDGEANSKTVRGSGACDEAQRTLERHALHVVQRQQQCMLDAMGRVDAIHCHTVEDLYAFCTAYQIPEAQQEHPEDEGCTLASGVKSGRRTPPRKVTAAAPVVPLVIVEGCGGENSYLYRYERAAGVSVPLQHWLLCLLQRRTRCALVLVEELSASQSLRQQQQQHQQPGSTDGGDDSISRSVAKASDVVSRLLAPHHHHRHPSAPADPLRSSSSPSSTASPSPTSAATAGAARREKKRPPILLIHDEDTGADFPFFQPPPPLGPFPPATDGEAAVAGEGKAAASSQEVFPVDQHLPIADIGGFHLTHVTFGAATVLSSAAAEQRPAMLVTPLRTR